MFKRTAYKWILMLPVLLLVALNGNAEMVGKEDLRDPTAPLVMGGVSSTADLLLGMPDNYALSSILIRSNLRVAVINSRRVSVGDQIGSARVTNIEKESVTLSVDGESRVIKLYEHSIKTRSASEG